MMLINNHRAALISSQAHAKPNKKGILGAFVIANYSHIELFVKFFILKSN